MVIAHDEKDVKRGKIRERCEWWKRKREGRRGGLKKRVEEENGGRWGR